MNLFENDSNAIFSDDRSEVIGLCVKAQYYISMNHMEDYRNEMEKLKHFTIKRR